MNNVGKMQRAYDLIKLAAEEPKHGLLTDSLITAGGLKGMEAKPLRAIMGLTGLAGSAGVAGYGLKDVGRHVNQKFGPKT